MALLTVVCRPSRAAPDTSNRRAESLSILVALVVLSWGESETETTVGYSLYPAVSDLCSRPPGPTPRGSAAHCLWPAGDSCQCVCVGGGGRSF